MLFCCCCLVLNVFFTHFFHFFVIFTLVFLLSSIYCMLCIYCTFAAFVANKLYRSDFLSSSEVAYLLCKSLIMFCRYLMVHHLDGRCQLMSLNLLNIVLQRLITMSSSERAHSDSL